MTEIERTFLVFGMAATPEERWDINRFFVNRLPLVARQAMEKESYDSAMAHQRLQTFVERSFSEVIIRDNSIETTKAQRTRRPGKGS